MDLGADVSRIGEFVRGHSNISPITLLMARRKYTYRISSQPHIPLMTTIGNTEIMLFVFQSRYSKPMPMVEDSIVSIASMPKRVQSMNIHVHLAVIIWE